MLNQATLEAFSSARATYLNNYLDSVENLPDELGRLLSRAFELDVTYRAFLSEVQQQQDFAKECDSTNKKKHCLVKIQQALISAQEIGDEKLEVIQQIQDIIENKTRQLDTDCHNLAEFNKEQETSDEKVKESSNGSHMRESSSSNGNNNTNERSSKRARRTRIDINPSLDSTINNEMVSTPEPSRQPTPVQTPTLSSSANTKKNSNISAGKKKKRKSRQQQQQQQVQLLPDDSPSHDDDLGVDPDEPTYCLCQQISYGEMIMCDNDLCPFEWFHFSCVSLNIKPKGKWFCPKCRGDRSSVMKPKSLFIKELRMNKEKELKEGKD